MAWTTPTPRSLGDLITTSIWNTDIVDNLNFLYGSLPSARAYHNAAISAGHNTTTVLSANSERWDNDVIHDTSSNNSRLTCKRAGKYIITVMAELASNVNYRYFSTEILLNGATVLASDMSEDDATSARALPKNAVTIYDLAVNDYVEQRVFQVNGGGGALNVNASGNYSPEIAMHRIGG